MKQRARGSYAGESNLHSLPPFREAARGSLAPCWGDDIKGILTVVLAFIGMGLVQDKGTDGNNKSGKT